MIEEKVNIKEVYNLKHINDNEIHTGYDYQTNMTRRLMSEVMFRNPNLNEFITKLQDQMVWMLESTLVMRNFFNHVVGKYYNRHNN
jgi:hypothetical protein